MNKLKVKLREPRRVYPKVTVVPATECRLDDPLRRIPTLAGRPVPRRGLDLDRGDRPRRHRHSTWVLVATGSPRVLVIGGAS